MESKYNKETYYGKQFQHRSYGGLRRVYTIMEDKFIPELGLSGYVTEFGCVLYTNTPGVNISTIHNEEILGTIKLLN